MQSRLFIALVLAGTVLVSCKKSAVAKNCDTAVNFAGHYKITKEEFVYTGSGVVTDQTATLTNCDLSGVYNFSANGTVVFTESNSCADTSYGTWSISGSLFQVNFPLGTGGKIAGTHIESWNCTNLIASTLYPSAVGNNRYTLTRQ